MSTTDLVWIKNGDLVISVDSATWAKRQAALSAEGWAKTKAPKRTEAPAFDPSVY